MPRRHFRPNQPPVGWDRPNAVGRSIGKRRKPLPRHVAPVKLNLTESDWVDIGRCLTWCYNHHPKHIQKLWWHRMREAIMAAVHSTEQPSSSKRVKIMLKRVDVEEMADIVQFVLPELPTEPIDRREWGARIIQKLRFTAKNSQSK